ncbi:hypothetical protein [Nostoc sp. PA-18-2419]|uniref:hypothetical protein n=1 Tax=Nostoc sp. PA-18-2419 TaxID=2575443 RepID=UPI00167522E7|nr:hypothetical protein [Nostoc sp. PA-18-2419]
MALLVEQEIEARKGKNSTHSLKSDDLERLYDAREILLENLDNPQHSCKLLDNNY